MIHMVRIFFWVGRRLAQNYPCFVRFPPSCSNGDALLLFNKFTVMNNEAQIRARVADWERAVQEKNYDGILAWHHAAIVMYDVPPPFESIGIDAYRKTWELFFRNTRKFRVLDLQVAAGDEVAFCYSPMKCSYRNDEARWVELDFRLTIGFKKIDGEWWFVHEHHSVPAG